MLALILILQGVETPHEPFFWPEAFLPKQCDEEPDQPLDPLEAGYSGYVQDGLDSDDEGQGQVRGQVQVEGHPGVGDEEEEEVEKEEDPYERFTVSLLSCSFNYEHFEILAVHVY